MRHRKTQDDDKAYIFVGVEGFLSQRELEKYIPLNRRTLYRYLGKYGYKRLNGFPERIAMGRMFRYRIYDVDLWLGRIKPGDKLGFMETKKKEKMIGLEDAADLLQYDDQYVRRLSREGVLPAYKTKRKWFYLTSELEQWMRENDRL